MIEYFCFRCDDKVLGEPKQFPHGWLRVDTQSDDIFAGESAMLCPICHEEFVLFMEAIRSPPEDTIAANTAHQVINTLGSPITVNGEVIPPGETRVFPAKKNE